MSSSYPSSSYTGGLGRFSSIFWSLFAIDQLRKIKSHLMETVIHKKRNYVCSRRSRAKTGREMYRKAWCTCKVVVLLIIWRSRYRPRRWILKPLIIHKMSGDQERPNQSVFSVHSAFRFNHWRQDVLSPVHSRYFSIDKEIKTTSGYWTWALKDVHRGRPLAFPFIPNIRMILGIKGKPSNIILILATPCLRENKTGVKS